MFTCVATTPFFERTQEHFGSKTGAFRLTPLCPALLPTRTTRGMRGTLIALAADLHLRHTAPLRRAPPRRRPTLPPALATMDRHPRRLLRPPPPTVEAATAEAGVMAEEAVVATEEGVAVEATAEEEGEGVVTEGVVTEGVAVEATAEEAGVGTEEVVVAVEATVEAVAGSAETGCRTLAIA